MARHRTPRRRPSRGQGHADPVPVGREIRLVRGRSDVAVPRRTPTRSFHRANVPQVQENPLSPTDVLRRVLSAHRRVDVHSRYGNDRNVLHLVSQHGCQADYGADPRRCGEPRRRLPEDGDDALFRRDDEGRDSDRDAREGRVDAAHGAAWERPGHPLFPTLTGGGAMTFLDRTTDARKFRHWEGDVAADYIYTSGVAGGRRLVALRDEGRMLASRCTACKLDYLPPRMFCEDSFAELTEYAYVPQPGRVAAGTGAHIDRTGAKLSHPQVWAFLPSHGVLDGLLHRLHEALKHD